MEGWSKGRNVTIAGVEVSDDGLVLRRSRFLKEDATRFFTWFEVSKGSHNGFLNFYEKPDKKFTTSFSYKEDWNVHIIDFAINKILEGKASKLSKILGNCYERSREKISGHRDKE